MDELSMLRQITDLQRSVDALCKALASNTAAIGFNGQAIVKLHQRLQLLEAGLACIEIVDDNARPTH